MSRIGFNPIQFTSDVTVTVEGQKCTVKGPKGELTITVPDVITVKVDGNEITLSRADEQETSKALHGTFRAHIANMVKGVTEGFERKLELHGVGYRVKKEGDALSLTLGYNHPIIVEKPEGVEFDVPDEVTIIVKGIDKQLVHTTAAEIRELKKPEPYKGKGIRYEGEHVRRKTPKSVAAS